MSNFSTLESQNILEYITCSENEKDFIERMNIFMRIVIMEIAFRVQDEMVFPIHCVDIIDSINHDSKNLINEINNTPIIENQPKVDEEIVMKIIKSSYPKLYSDYIYNTQVILN